MKKRETCQRNNHNNHSSGRFVGENWTKEQQRSHGTQGGTIAPPQAEEAIHFTGQTDPTRSPLEDVQLLLLAVLEPRRVLHLSPDPVALLPAVHVHVLHAHRPAVGPLQPVHQLAEGDLPRTLAPFCGRRHRYRFLSSIIFVEENSLFLVLSAHGARWKKDGATAKKTRSRRGSTTRTSRDNTLSFLLHLRCWQWNGLFHPCWPPILLNLPHCLPACLPSSPSAAGPTPLGSRCCPRRQCWSG